MTEIEIKNMDGLEYLSSIPDGSVNLILTDPPYIISKESGMNTHYKNVKYNEEHNIEFVKTEDEWIKYKQDNKIEDDIHKENYMKYGTIYGKSIVLKLIMVIGIIILR